MSSDRTKALTITISLDDPALEHLAVLVADKLSAPTVESTSAYTTRTLAAEVGVSERSIRGAIQRGDLEAVRRGRRYLISADAVRAWTTPTSTGTSSRGANTSTGRSNRRRSTGTLTATLADLSRGVR